MAFEETVAETSEMGGRAADPSAVDTRCPSPQSATVAAGRSAAAAERVNAAIAPPSARRSSHPFRQRPLVYATMAAYAIASIGLMATKQVGITSEHVILIGLVLFAVVGRARPFVWDWLPFLFVAVMFEDLSAVGAKIAGKVHDIAPILFERSFLGGAVGATWLQQHIGYGVFGRGLGFLLSGEYLFHFAAPLVAGMWLWMRHRDRFGTFVGAYILVMGMGFIGYLVYPEMPPWLAANKGFLPPMHRIVVDTLQNLGGFGSFYAGADPEPNAAMPSLHVSVPLIVSLSIISVKGWRNRRAWLWLLYPLTVSFGVVYLGEHYISDTVVGLALGALCFGIAEAFRVLSLRREAQLVAVSAPVRSASHRR
jgi:membrane-associated phospholipid phosphatase